MVNQVMMTVIHRRLHRSLAYKEFIHPHRLHHLTYRPPIIYTIYTHTRGVWVKRQMKIKAITMTTETQHALEEGTTALQPQIVSDSHVILALEGMTCASCAMRIEKGLKKLPV